MKKINTKLACELARLLEGVTERDHFGSDAFSAGGRIFATVWHDKNEVNLMFTPELQREYVGLDGEGFSAVPNKWGEKGATTAHLEELEVSVFESALRAAWECRAVKVAEPAKRTKSRSVPKRVATTVNRSSGAALTKKKVKKVIKKKK